MKYILLLASYFIVAGVVSTPIENSNPVSNFIHDIFENLGEIPAPIQITNDINNIATKDTLMNVSKTLIRMIYDLSKANITGAQISECGYEAVLWSSFTCGFDESNSWKDLMLFTKCAYSTVSHIIHCLLNPSESLTLYKKEPFSEMNAYFEFIDSLIEYWIGLGKATKTKMIHMNYWDDSDYSITGAGVTVNNIAQNEPLHSIFDYDYYGGDDVMEDD